MQELLVSVSRLVHVSTYVSVYYQDYGPCPRCVSYLYGIRQYEPHLVVIMSLLAFF